MFMGVDLKLLIVDGKIDGVPYFSHSMLEVSRRRELWGPIGEIEKKVGRDVPVNFYTFVGRQENGEHGYGQTNCTPYGDPLKYVTVADLLPIESLEGVQDSPTNVAIWAWMKAMPPETMIALYWH